MLIPLPQQRKSAHQNGKDTACPGGTIALLIANLETARRVCAGDMRAPAGFAPELVRERIPPARRSGRVVAVALVRARPRRAIAFVANQQPDIPSKQQRGV